MMSCVAEATISTPEGEKKEKEREEVVGRDACASPPTYTLILSSSSKAKSIGGWGDYSVPRACRESITHNYQVTEHDPYGNPPQET